MREFKCDPNAEIIGQNVLAFVQNLRAEEVQPFLKKHGLENVDPEKWYPLQDWLNVLNDIQREGEAMSDFVGIGMAIAETAPLPPETEGMNLEQFFGLLNPSYQMQHRSGDVGKIESEKVGDKHIKVTVDVPYPDDLEYGTAYGFAKRFLPKGTRFVVKYDEKQTRKDHGGENTIIHVTWE
jgi:hypothetical protein